MSVVADAIFRNSPVDILKNSPEFIERVLDEYTYLLEKPVSRYLVWPLQIGGTRINFSSISFDNALCFEGIAPLQEDDDDAENIGRLFEVLQQKRFSSMVTDYPPDAYLHVRLQVCTDEGDRKSRAKLFAAFCSMRLASRGDIAATQCRPWRISVISSDVL